MKTATAQVREVEAFGIEDARAFSIDNNAAAFDTLIDRLYSDKILAVMREIWSNAFDAHVALGTPGIAFDCQLPTVFDPVFKVRDFGVSLCHADVMELYTTVFRSSKTGTNKQVGKFGLGSKSPFAYVDTFSVTTWFNGEKRTYSAYRDEERIPRILPMSCEDSDEPQGLEVSFPVKVCDVDAFAERAERLLLGFTVAPNMTGRDVDKPEIEVVMEDENLWQLCKADYDVFQKNTAYARQGCVVYPINADAIPGISDAQAAVLTSPFFINFPIGSLQMTPSRESLSYDPKTCRNILQAVDVILDEVRRRYSEQLASSPTYMAACLAYSDMKRGPLGDALKTMLTTGMVWRGRKLTLQIDLSHVLNHPQVKSKASCTYWAGPVYGRRRLKVMKWEASSHIHFQVTSQPLFYFEDTSRHNAHIQGRIRYDFDQKKARGAQAMVWIRARKDSYALKRLFVAMGRPQLIDAASLPKPPPNLAGYIKRPVKMRVLDSYGSFHTADVDEDDQIAYVNMERGDLCGSGYRGVSGRSIHDLRKQLIAANALDPSVLIVAVPRTCKRAISRNAHWVFFWDVVKQAVVQHYDPVGASVAHHTAELLRDDGFDYVRRLNEACLVPASNDGWMRKLMHVYARLENRAQKHNGQLQWHDMASYVQSTTLAPYHVQVHPLMEKVTAAYPMLEIFGNYISDHHLQKTLDYVNLIDKHS